jgi:hypothetical protein
VIDIDKRAFGIGPITESWKASAIEHTKTNASNLMRSTSVGEKLQPKSQGMHARLEALANQLDQLEIAASNLQSDLAFSVKVLFLLKVITSLVSIGG